MGRSLFSEIFWELIIDAGFFSAELAVSTLMLSLGFDMPREIQPARLQLIYDEKEYNGPPENKIT